MPQSSSASTLPLSFQAFSGGGGTTCIGELAVLDLTVCICSDTKCKHSKGGLWLGILLEGQKALKTEPHLPTLAGEQMPSKQRVASGDMWEVSCKARSRLKQNGRGNAGEGHVNAYEAI
jgi:hypothetical protein